MNASSKWASWLSSPRRQAASARDRPAIGLVAAGHDPQERRLAGAVGPDEADPLAGRDRGVTWSRMTKRADLPDDALQADEAHDGPRACTPPVAPPRAAFVRAGALAGLRRLVGRPAERPVAVELHPAAAPPARAARPGRGVIVAEQLRRGRALRGGQALAERAEVRRPDADHDPPDRPAAARARLPGALVDVQVLLHLAVAVGRRVVVDRASRAARPPRPGSPGRCGRGRARRAGAARRRSAAGGAASATAPRPRRCCRCRR